MNRAIFIDKDGTLVEDIPYNVDPKLLRFTEGAVDGLIKLRSRGYLLILVSNQSGVAHGYFREEALRHVEEKIQEMLSPFGVWLDASFFCPHHPQGRILPYSRICECRKPQPGMILKAAEQLTIDLKASWMIGDILNDVEAGTRAGCKTILIDNGNETEWVISEKRQPTATARNLGEAADLIIHQYEAVL